MGCPYCDICSHATMLRCECGMATRCSAAGCGWGSDCTAHAKGCSRLPQSLRDLTLALVTANPGWDAEDVADHLGDVAVFDVATVGNDLVREGLLTVAEEGE